MNCFYHREVHAVGVCKNCSRGLCPDCAAEVFEGLACRSRCEDAVAAVSRLIDRSRRLAPRAGGQYLWLGLFLIGIGLGSGYEGLFVFRRGPQNFMTFFGLIAFAMGAYYMRLAQVVKRS